MDAEQIAVLMTCHNRRETTLRCLRALYDQELSEGMNFETYLVDDRCTDGTGEAVREQYPQVKVLQGDGVLFWNGGMRLAFSEAMKGDYDYYLWLNDDTYLYPQAIQILLETARRAREINGRDGIVVGAMCDPDTGEPAYGGLIRKNRWKRFGFMRVAPSDKPRRCDTMNGNFVLIPREVTTAVGNLSDAYMHFLGDYDYGLRAVKKGYSCWVAPGFVGTCTRKSWRGSFRDSDLPMCQQLEKMRRPTGLPSVREWMVFTWRHAGIMWPVFWLRTLVRAFFPRLWLLLRSGPPGPPK